MSVIPSSITIVSLVNGATFATGRCNNSLTRQSTFKVRVRQRYNHPLLGSLRLFPHNQIGWSLRCKSRNHHIVLATETGVAVEEQDSPVDGEDSGQSTGAPTELEEGPAPAQTKRSRAPRKSEMPPVKNEELVPGTTFMGKVRSIQPFGAFVDFGAFTDGLVHVSQLSNSFVKDVGSFVSVGQEVKVRLLEANTETGRISLSMREGVSSGTKTLQQAGSTSSGDSKPKTPRKNAGATGQKRAEARKTSKFVKGQNLTGTVKNLTRSGAFVSLPEGEEGFLPISEEADDGLGRMMGSTSLEIGQEVNARVLRIARGQVTLTMKEEEDVGKLVAELTQGIVYEAKNPFVLAFQKNKEIAMFLSEKENLDKSEREIGLKEDEGIPELVEASVSESLDTSVLTDLKEQEENSEDLSAENNELAASFISEAASTAEEPQNDESVNHEQTGEVREPTGSLLLEEAPAVDEPKTDESVKNDQTEVSEPTENLFSEEAASTVEPKASESVTTPELSESSAGLASEEATARDELKIDESAEGEAEDAPAKDTEQVEETIAEISEEVKVEDQVEPSAEENDTVLDSEVQTDVSSSETTGLYLIAESNIPEFL